MEMEQVDYVYWSLTFPYVHVIGYDIVALHLKQQSLLRIHQLGLKQGNAKINAIEQINVLKEATESCSHLILCDVRCF